MEGKRKGAVGGGAWLYGRVGTWDRAISGDVYLPSFFPLFLPWDVLFGADTTLHCRGRMVAYHIEEKAPGIDVVDISLDGGLYHTYQHQHGLLCPRLQLPS